VTAPSWTAIVITGSPTAVAMMLVPSRDHVGWVTDTPAVGKVPVGRPDGVVMIKARDPPMASEPVRWSPIPGAPSGDGTVVVGLVPLSDGGSVVVLDGESPDSMTVVVGAEKRAWSSSGLTDVQLPARRAPAVRARPSKTKRTFGPYPTG